MKVLVYQLHTIPDIDSGRRFYQLDGLPDKDVAKAMYHMQKSQADYAEVSYPMQQIVCLSAIEFNDGQLSFHSVSAPQSEADMLGQFFLWAERAGAPLVNWQHSQRLQALLQYRALLHAVVSPLYWQQRNQLHLDMANLLGGTTGQPLSLSSMARWLQLPPIEDAPDTWELAQAGQFQTIETHCQRACVINYLLYLRFERIRGNLSAEAYQHAYQHLQARLPYPIKGLTDGRTT